MFSICHCWSRTPQGRGGWTRTRRNWTPATMIAGNTSWKQFGTARSMRENQNRVIYQASTTWCLGKGTRRKRIPGSQPQRSSTLESSSARSTRTTLTSRRRLLLQSTPHHRWPSPPNLSSGNEDNRQDALRSAPSARCAKQGDKEEATRRNLSQCSSKSQKPAGSRRSVFLAQRALGSLQWQFVDWQFDSWKNYTAPYSDQVPYYPSLSSSKLFLSPPILISLHQSRFFLPCPQSRLEGFFIDNTYTYDLSVFLLNLPLIGLGGFSSIDPLSGFLPQSFYQWVRRFFTSDMIL